MCDSFVILSALGNSVRQHIPDILKVTPLNELLVSRLTDITSKLNAYHEQV